MVVKKMNTDAKDSIGKNSVQSAFHRNGYVMVKLIAQMHQMREHAKVKL